MIRRIGVIGLTGIAMMIASVACDDLALPPGAADGGAQTEGNATSGTLPAYAPTNAILGESKAVFNANIATWATLDAAGKVDTVSWNLPLVSVTSLESATFMGRAWLRVPTEVVRDTSITGIAVDFLPTGHLPNGVYNVQHWEFHVAFQALAEVQNIDCADPTLPPQQILPQGYGLLPPPDNCMPAMGIHAINFAAPEFNAQRFTHSNVLVYYKGNSRPESKIASFESKATTQLLKERKSFTIALPSLPPNAIGRPGASPTTLTANYDSANDAYVITTSGFVPAS